MDPLTSVILEIAKTLHVPPVTAAVMIPLIIAMANRGARLIPDTATGPLKWLRVALMILGIHVKDNSGVPAKTDAEGNAVRRAAPESLPLTETPEQGELLLSDADRVNLFRRAAEAQARDDDHAG